MENILRDKVLNIPSLEKGYYIITNVFSKPNLASNWEEYLISKGLKAKTFINPNNNWHYVYVYKSDDIYQVYKNHQKLSELNYFKEIWVFIINMDK